MKHQAAYAAFDLFPSSKGASTHISHMARFLFEKFDGGLLLTLGSPLSPVNETEGKVEAKRFSASIPNYLHRAQAFSHHVQSAIKEARHLQIVHFRDIWSGLGILQGSKRHKTLFEVNGLPSIELPYRYPSIPDTTLEKIKALEDFCLNQSDQLIAPSGVIKENLVKRGISSDKVEIVTNAASTTLPFEDITGLPDRYVLYFGALQPWQGMDTLLKAFALLQDIGDLHLVICASQKKKYTKTYIKLAEKLGIAENIIWQYQLQKSELNTYIKKALLTVAPLRACSRNIEQGCSPLKIFESLACGTPVIASDLPVTREIIEDGISGKLVRPDRPQELSRAIRILLEYPEKREAYARAGQSLIHQQYNWEKIKRQMFAIYDKAF